VISIAVVAALLAALQSVSLFVVKDVRDRVMRLETRAMDNATWHVEHVPGD
jgi:hypothetical protein